MKKNLTNENENQALATQTTAAVAVQPEHDEESELALLGAEVFEELNNAARELEIGFQHTKASTILERDESFMIIDAIQTEIPDDKKPDEMKTVYVWLLQMQSGDMLSCMQGHNSVREKWAAPFLKTHKLVARGIAAQCVVGPVKFIKFQPRTKQPQDAITFATLPGFKVSAGMVRAPQA